MTEPGKPTSRRHRRGATSLTGPIARRTLDRQVEALALLAQGMQFRQIAETMGVSVSTAHGYIKKAMAATLQQAADEARGVMNTRLDAMIARWLPLALDKGHKRERRALNASDLVLKLFERQAKLNGLDAPQVVQGPDGAPLSFVVALPPQAASVEAWQAQAAGAIDVTPQELPALGQTDPDDDGGDDAA